MAYHGQLVERLKNKPNAGRVANAEDKLVIALDFGTTFSGIAYAFDNTAAKPELVSIKDWPGTGLFLCAEGRKQPKTPTIISYDSKDKTKFSWGAQKPDRDIMIEAIKMHLDPEEKTPKYVPSTDTRAELRRVGKSATEISSDYMKAIYDHAMKKIGEKVPAEYIKMCEQHFVLSVPAMSSDKAKYTELTAAKQAGIAGTITLIKEPEAAALYTVHMLKHMAMAVGDAFVLCDAGGGTVDLISYEITALHPTLTLKELVPGKGRQAGSLMLNKRFEQLIQNLVGDKEFQRIRKTKGYETAKEQFDLSIKTAFAATDEEYIVSFPMANLIDNPEKNIESNCITLESNQVKEIFRPVIADIEQLVGEQVKGVKVKRRSEKNPKAEEIKAIFLVGGFGSSAYLKSCLQSLHPKIQVIQPEDAWSAVVKGAVLSELPQEAHIISTVATRHYGVEQSSDYNAREDLGQPTWRDSFTNKLKVSKGDDLKRDQKVIFPFCRSVEANYNPDDLIFHDKLMHSEAIRPVKYPTSGITKVNCSMMSDLSKVPRKHFVRRTAYDGRPYYDIHFDLVVRLQSAVMTFSLESNGEELGSVEANYG
ncbi:MAG: hypothetical protein M1823_005673 [Watsoniomyces obsoletus]|nr:MAG: hypothetical protein M1823_005673 [Watsoniomyces obsoletus]